MAYSVCSRASNHNRVTAIVRRLRFTILRAGDQEGILEKPLSSQSSCLTGEGFAVHCMLLHTAGAQVTSGLQASYEGCAWWRERIRLS